MSTYAQEKAERVRAEREAPFRATHDYEPIGWDRFRPMSYDGEQPIYPDSPVQVLKEAAPAGLPRDFARVRDVLGTEQTVDRRSLKRRKRR